jgi:CRISPR-associated protein Csb2
MRALCISATFLTGRYHGAEWPPSPARLLQAMLAGVKTGGYRELWPRVEQGFQWLERRPAPSILVRPTDGHCTSYKLAVPNNDLDTVAHEWAAGRRADVAKIRTIKMVSPRPLEASEPHVRYVWPLEEGEDGEGVAAMLRPLSHCLYSLGWGVDMAYADLELETDVGSDGWQEWVPSRTKGKQLPVPVPGFLEDLEATYARFKARTSGKGVDTDTRPAVYQLQRYARRDELVMPSVTFSLLTVDGESLSKGWHDAMKISAWMRHAAAEALRGEAFGEDVDSYVLGHTPKQSDASHRMSFVPLPSIGHPNSDGRTRRVLFAEPPTGSGRAVELLGFKLPGTTLTDVNKREVCMLAPSADDGVIGRYMGGERGAQDWRSVTPVVLHGYNSMRGVVSVAKTEKLLLRAFEMAGYRPESIERMAFQAAPLWPGAGSARAVRVPEHLDGYPRYHVEVRFRRPVSGPVLAGIGRHYGVGLFGIVR